MKKLLLTGFLALTLSVNSYGMCGFFGFGCTPPPVQTKVVEAFVPLVPTFENVRSVTNMSNGQQIINQANDKYFATEETAQAVAKRFGASRVEYRESIQNLGANYLYTNGTAAIVRVLIFSPGAVLEDNTGRAVAIVSKQFEVNAGVIADYFRRMPEKTNPAYTSIFGSPPVETHYLALAELYVWQMLIQVNPLVDNGFTVFETTGN